MSKTYFETELGKKIIYREPIFVAPIEFNKNISTFGGDAVRELYDEIMRYTEIKERFLFLMHKTFTNATLMLRRIFLTESISPEELRGYITNDELLNKYQCPDVLDDAARDILDKHNKSLAIMPFPFWRTASLANAVNSLKDGMRITGDDEIIIKIYNMDDDNSGFLIQWGEFIEQLQGGKCYFNSVETIKREMTRKGFVHTGLYTPQTIPSKNPGFFTYMSFKKIA